MYRALRASRPSEEVSWQRGSRSFRSNPACKLRLREPGSPMGSPKFLWAIHIVRGLEQPCGHSRELVCGSDRLSRQQDGARPALNVPFSRADRLRKLSACCLESTPAVALLRTCIGCPGRLAGLPERLVRTLRWDRAGGCLSIRTARIHGLKPQDSVTPSVGIGDTFLFKLEERRIVTDLQIFLNRRPVPANQARLA